MPCSQPSISTNTPTGVSSIATIDVFVRELLAILLVAEPDVQSKLPENLEQDFAVADQRLVLFPHLHRRRLDGALEGHAALAVLHAHAQDASPPAKLFVVGVEQGVRLEAAAQPRRAAGRDDGSARLLDRVESQLDLSLERRLRDME